MVGCILYFKVYFYNDDRERILLLFQLYLLLVFALFCFFKGVTYRKTDWLTPQMAATTTAKTKIPELSLGLLCRSQGPNSFDQSPATSKCAY